MPGKYDKMLLTKLFVLLMGYFGVATPTKR